MTGRRTDAVDWSDEVFFGWLELLGTSAPGFFAVFYLGPAYPNAIPVAGFAAVVVGSAALALFRTRTVDVGRWPRRSELRSLPLRIVHFSLTFVAAGVGVAALAAAMDPKWLLLLGGGVETLGLAAFPTAYGLAYGDPPRNPARRA